MSFVVLQGVLTTVPFLALTVVGIILFRRERTLATALVALGFAIETAGRLYSAILGIVFAYTWKPGAVWSARGWAYTVFHWGTMLEHWALILGPWLAAAGLLWYTLGRASALPNLHWRRP